jgi:hypothetical protein
VTTPAPSPRRRDAAGIVALVLAIVLIVAQIVQVALATAVPLLAFRNGLGADLGGAVFAVLGLGQLLLAVATAIVGVVGVLRKDRPKVLSAVALGVGGSVAVVQLAALVVPGLVGLALGG